MGHYRRFHVAGATYFFTVCAASKGADTLICNINALRWAYAKTIAEHPVECHAMVVLPDHLHAIWQLPNGDADFAIRWRKIKARFSHAVGHADKRSASTIKKRETGVWQRRYWEHMIRHPDELQELKMFCWNDPVKHALVARREDWAYSSFAKCRVGNLPTTPTKAFA
jgi:putative transposase